MLEPFVLVGSILILSVIFTRVYLRLGGTKNETKEE